MPRERRFGDVECRRVAEVSEVAGGCAQGSTLVREQRERMREGGFDFVSLTRRGVYIPT